MKEYKTAQEDFWAGDFGNSYISRNISKKLLASNINLFSEIITRTSGVQSIFELGANIGMNIIALNSLLPDSKTSALEINPKAFKKLKKVCTGKAYLQSILDMDIAKHSKYDFVFTKGVLIHINPGKLNKAYDAMYKLSNRYICIVEYYNPSPVSIEYRGERDKLFKRDFAGEMLGKYKNLSLVDYGFKYQKDNNFLQDDVTWFLMEKMTTRGIRR
jgi:pseudaminic acid biosynthesis-associated methylase